MNEEINIDYLANKLESLRISRKASRISGEYSFKESQDFHNNRKNFIIKKLSEFYGEFKNSLCQVYYSSRHPKMLNHYKSDRVKEFFIGLNEDFRLPVDHIFICDRLDGMDDYLLNYDYRNTNPAGFCSRVMFKNEEVLRDFLVYVMDGLIEKDARLIAMLDPLKDGFWILKELVSMLNSDDDRRRDKEESDKAKSEKKKKDCYLGF